MKIKDLLKPEAIKLGATAASKENAIDELIALHEKTGDLNDPAGFKEAILKRESESTTAIGEGIAVPHAKTNTAKYPGLAAMTVPDGVDYDAPDGMPSTLFFMIAVPEGAGDAHLEILSHLMMMLMDPDFSNSLRNASSPEEFLDIITKQEAVQFPDEKPAEEAQAEAPAKDTDEPAAAEAESAAPAEPEKPRYRILAVTACPNGIAHTYMAAEALDRAGEEMGIPIKVETDGAGGAKNVLTPEEIADAEGIIVAADKAVPTDRFDGKPVLKVEVSAGINRPKELIQDVVDGKAPTWHAKNAEGGKDAAFGQKESGWHKVYQELMGGVSHMLPFVIGGGLLIAIAFLIDTIFCQVHGVQPGQNFGSMLAASKWFNAVGNLAFDFMLPILAGFIAYAIADLPALAVGVVGGYMAKIGSTWAEPAGNAAGISAGFIGALIAGFAAGYVIKLLELCFRKMPKNLEGLKPMLLYPLCGVALIGVIMCTIDPLMILINTGFAKFLTFLNAKHLSVLLGFILAAMMASDMGGPINKAAYLFGTGMLTAAVGYTGEAQTMCYEIMAAVMIGGMAPPLSLALATSFFPWKFTKQERKTGPTLYVMGLSFVTEGAIPFAAADPGRVLPSVMVGSGVAGALSMLFKCTLRAPHGGIFVIATVGHWYWYLVALVVGAFVGMGMLFLTKKNQATKEEIKQEKAEKKALKAAAKAK